MELLYGTSNLAKLSHMEDMLKGIGVNVISINTVGVEIDVQEIGNCPLENAIIKAKAYYEKTHIPCFSADSGLYIDGLSEEEQPGVKVRRVDNRYLDDEEFIAYYKNLALKLGGKVKAKFKNAICLILDDKNIYTYDGDDIADHFILTSTDHPKRRRGFPMDSIALDIETGFYFVEEKYLKNEEYLRAGMRDFFIRTLKLKRSENQ